MLSVAPALANIAGVAAVVSAAFAVALSVLAFSPDAHATVVAAMTARGSRWRGSRTMLRMAAPWIVGVRAEVARARLENVNVTGLSTFPRLPGLLSPHAARRSRRLYDDSTRLRRIGMSRSRLLPRVLSMVSRRRMRS